MTENEKGYSVDYRGVHFTSPFHCLCCGAEISVRQFAFGRACGYCDCGRCCEKGYYQEGHGNLWRVKPNGDIECVHTKTSSSSST